MMYKVSDGDLIIVTMPACGNSAIAEMANIFREWATNRGLHNVTVKCFGVEGLNDLSIRILSVNDVFENEVLNKNKF